MPDKYKVVVIRSHLKPVFVAQVIEMDKKDLFELVEEAKQNAEQLEGEYSHIINRLIDRIENLEKEVKHLKGED